MRQEGFDSRFLFDGRGHCSIGNMVGCCDPDNYNILWRLNFNVLFRVTSFSVYLVYIKILIVYLEWTLLKHTGLIYMRRPLRLTSEEAPSALNTPETRSPLVILGAFAAPAHTRPSLPCSRREAPAYTSQRTR